MARGRQTATAGPARAGTGRRGAAGPKRATSQERPRRPGEADLRESLAAGDRTRARHMIDELRRDGFTIGPLTARDWQAMELFARALQALGGEAEPPPQAKSVLELLQTDAVREQALLVADSLGGREWERAVAPYLATHVSGQAIVAQGPLAFFGRCRRFLRTADVTPASDLRAGTGRVVRIRSIGLGAGLAEVPGACAPYIHATAPRRPGIADSRDVWRVDPIEVSIEGSAYRFEACTWLGASRAQTDAALRRLVRAQGLDERLLEVRTGGEPLCSVSGYTPAAAPGAHSAVEVLGRARCRHPDAHWHTSRFGKYLSCARCGNERVVSVPAHRVPDAEREFPELGGDARRYLALERFRVALSGGDPDSVATSKRELLRDGMVSMDPAAYRDIAPASTVGVSVDQIAHRRRA